MRLAEELVEAAIAAVVETAPGTYRFDAARFAALRAALQANASGAAFHAIVHEMCVLGVFLQKKREHQALAHQLLSMLDEVAAPEAARLVGKQVAIATARVDAVGMKFSTFMGRAAEQLPDSGARLDRIQLTKSIRG